MGCAKIRLRRQAHQKILDITDHYGRKAREDRIRGSNLAVKADVNKIKG